MTRSEFLTLKRLPGKEIHGDIEFRREKTGHGDAGWVEFSKVKVTNSLDYEILLAGWHNQRTRTTIYCFYVSGIGAVCRVEVNGKKHGSVGRTHKQYLMHETDPRDNLPHTEARPDLEKMTARQLWDTVCREAKIEHSGAFVDP